MVPETTVALAGTLHDFASTLPSLDVTVMARNGPVPLMEDRSTPSIMQLRPSWTPISTALPFPSEILPPLMKQRDCTST